MTYLDLNSQQNRLELIEFVPQNQLPSYSVFKPQSKIRLQARIQKKQRPSHFLT